MSNVDVAIGEMKRKSESIGKERAKLETKKPHDKSFIVWQADLDFMAGQQSGLLIALSILEKHECNAIR
jgi:hypothetical protein